MSKSEAAVDQLRGLIARGRVMSATRARRIVLNVQLLNGEVAQNVELLLPYGRSAIPLPGGDVVLAAVGGVRDGLVALQVDDSARRVRDLAPGELGDSNGLGTQTVIRAWGYEITTTGNVQLQADGAITITAPAINIGGVSGGAAPAVAIGGVGGSVSLTGTLTAGAGAWTANGTTGVSFSPGAPPGAHADVQEWLTITDATGNVRYIPAW